jgi:hypothetical protein
MWKNIVAPNRPRIAWLIPKTTNTHSRYVILVTFPLQQWLYECTSLLHCTYIASLVGNCGFQELHKLVRSSYVPACVLTIDSGLVKTHEGYQTVNKK